MSFTIGTALTLGSLATGVVGMVGAGQTASAQARGSIATTKAQLELQKANTHLDNAQASLANFMTAFNNNRQLTQYGKAKEAMEANLARQGEFAASSKLERGIQQAEALGAFQANAVSKGTGGASHDAIEASMRLAQARSSEGVDRQRRIADYDGLQAMAGIADNSLMALDLGVNSGSVNTSVASPNITGGPNYASMIAQSGIMDSLGKMYQGWSAGSHGKANLSVPNRGLGLSPGGGSLGLKAPTSASTSFFNLGATSYSLY